MGARSRGRRGGSYGERLAAEHVVDAGLPARQHRPADRRERRRAGLPARRPGGRLADRRTPDRAGRPLDGRPDHAGRLRGAPPTPTRPWTDLVTDVVTLGTPHLGAPLERGVALGARALGLLPESAPFGRILEYRSVGILDLRGGLAPDVQNLPNARYHLVAATLAASHRHPVSETLGDLLVRYPSATGRPRRGPRDVPRRRRAAHPGRPLRPAQPPRRSYDALRAWLA